MEEHKTENLPLESQNDPHKQPVWRKKIIINISIVVVVIILGTAITMILKDIYYQAKDTGVTCTLEAKICPDGSAVGRTGPNCEFAACPTEVCKGGECPATEEKENTQLEKEAVLNETANWDVYENGNFSFKYPSNFNLDKIEIEIYPSDIEFNIWVEENTSSGFSIITDCNSPIEGALCKSVNITDIKHFVNLGNKYALITYLEDDPEKETIEKILGTIEFK